MSDIKRCPHCGKQLHSQAQYCMFCMTSLQPKQDITPKVHKRKKWTVAAILLFAVMILLILFFVYSCIALITKWKQGDEDRTTQPDELSVEGTEDTPSHRDETDDTSTTGESIPEETEEPTREDTQPQMSEDTTEEPETGEPEPKPSTEALPTKPVCEHYYTAASCIAPMTCQKCADTRGSADASAHTWKPVTAVVHHDEVGHYEETEDYYQKTVYLCFFCGYNQDGYDTLDDLQKHITVHSDAADYDWIVERSDLLADTRQVWATRTEQKWVVDEEAYDETVTTGYVCTLCNKQKET